MRLTGLTLCRYGIFDAQRIELDPNPGCINLLVAPNGAGKSIIRQAFCDLLFGIHGQTPMGFRFGYNGMKLAAGAIGPDGTAFGFGRRKGQGNTLTGADGTPLGGVELARLLGHTDRALLERLFALDTERLRSGGRDLLASDGAVADALLSAAGGLRQARQLRQSLEVQRDNLAPTRKSAARPFYAGLDRFVGAGRRLRAATVKPEARETQQTGLRHLEAEQAQLNKLAAQASGRIARLERIRRVVGPLRAHDDAASWLRDHPTAPILPPDIRRRLTAARAALFSAVQLEERETRARQALSEQVGDLVVDDALIDQAEAIERLNDRAGAARQAAGDIPTVGAKHAVAAQRIAGLLGQLGLSLPIERAGEAIPPQAAVIRARKLFTQHTTLRANLERLPGEIAKADADITETEAALRRLPAAPDTGDLQRMIGDIRADGEPRQRAQQSDHAVIERRARLQAALARTPGWTQGAEALVALSPLSANAYGRLDKARAKAKTILDTAAGALARLQRSVAEDEQQLKQIAAGAPMPDNAALTAARETRDAGWRLIFRRAFTPEPPTSAQEQAWAGAVPLPLAYERSVTAADDVADRRNQDAERLARVAELQRGIDNAAAGIAKADADRSAAERVHDEACAALKQACEPLGLSVPAELGDVTELLSAREHVIEAMRELTVAEAGQSTLQSRHGEWSARLSAALGQADDAPADLSDLLQRADSVIAAANDAAVKRTALQSTLASQRKTRDANLIEQGNAAQRLQQFETDWAGARRDLARPEGEDADTTIALLDLIGELDKEHRAAIDLCGRLREMHDALAVFRADAAALAGRIAPDVADADAFEIGTGLRRRLAQQRELAERRNTLAAQLEKTDAAVARQHDQHARCADELRATLLIIGAGSPEAAEERVAVAEERAKQQQHLDDAVQELHEKGDGRSFDQLRAEAGEVPIEDVPAQITQVGNERDRINAEAQDLAGRIATMRLELDRQAHDTEVQAAAAEQQAAIATIGHALDEAALMHLAAMLLQGAFDAVEALGTSGLMTRIGELFRTITNGTYQGIDADDPGDGSARLVAVEQRFPDERKTVGELSEGTRDQLFLALRLAAIEEHVATAPPLPFLGDDILQTFDDDRAVSAMQALVQLSETVQVILLSHHRHLLSVARRLPAEQVRVCEIVPGLVA